VRARGDRRQFRRVTNPQRQLAGAGKRRPFISLYPWAAHLTVEKRVQESVAEVHQKAKREVEESLKLKVTEKEEQIASMQRQIEELKRKAEQGLQQLQGEALELELETALRAKFPMDSIEPVEKGEFGGVVVQRVMSPVRLVCGSILFESKSTKHWSDGWLGKVRGDQAPRAPTLL
jgi:hypothetical protein